MKIVLVMMLLLVGCSDTDELRSRHVQVCTDETVTGRADFILKCVENANPKSDEEPEDWIRECEKMATNTYCKMVPAFYHWTEYGVAPGGRSGPTIFCSKATNEAEKAFCNGMAE